MDRVMSKAPNLRVVEGASMADRVRSAAENAGILPSDPLWALIVTMAETTEWHAQRDEQARAVQQASLDRATEAVRENSKRALVTDAQVKAYLLPRLVAGWLVSVIVVSAALMFAAALGGYIYARETAPPQKIFAGIDTGAATKCDPTNEKGDTLCWIPVWRDKSPPPPAPPAPPTVPPAPAMAHPLKGGR
jgi:hypothetical protein